MTTPFHVYAEDGFVSAHYSEAAAIRVAKRYAKVSRATYIIYECGPDGYTSANSGSEVCRVSPRGAVVFVVAK